MKKKVTAMVLASVMAAPFAMVGSSFAAGSHQQGGVRAAADSTSTKIELEAEMRFRATGINAEAQVEWEQGMRNGVTRTKLSAEVEVVVVGTTTPTLGQPQLFLSGGEICDFVNPPILTTFLRNGLTFQLVEFRGSALSIGGVVTPKGLNCSAVPTIAPATVDVTVSGTPTIIFPQGVFVND
jgi:hypothetical protein